MAVQYFCVLPVGTMDKTPGKEIGRGKVGDLLLELTDVWFGGSPMDVL